jgi:DNA-binding PadR family transcriptional regulator
MPKHRDPRLSLQTLRVLDVLLAAPRDELSGTDVRRATDLASGTLYPILARLEDVGWLESRWENADPSEVGRPRRRYYRVTAVGAEKALKAFGQLSRRSGGPAWQ